MAPQTLAQPELLTSWKEIANYLGKGVRTVQRWEVQFGLPVRRPNEKTKGIVHATTRDLDRWLEAQWSQRRKDDDESQLAVRPNGKYVEAVRAAIEQSVQLRQKNRVLLKDIRTKVDGVVAECHALSSTITGFPKAS